MGREESKYRWTPCRKCVVMELPVSGAVSQTERSCPLRAPKGPETTAQRKDLETADLQNLWHLFTQASSSFTRFSLE